MNNTKQCSLCEKIYSDHSNCANIRRYDACKSCQLLLDGKTIEEYLASLKPEIGAEIERDKTPTVDKDVKTGLWKHKSDNAYIKVRSIGLTIVRYSVECGTSEYHMGVSELLSDYELYQSDEEDDSGHALVPKAVQILNEASAIMAERGKAYDSTGQGAERSMDKIVTMFNALTGHSLTTAQGWKFMCCLKLARSEQGEHREDNYLDGAAYFALAGETAAEDSE